MRAIQMPAAVLLVVSALFASSACTDHFTTQEAVATCTELTERNPATNPPTAFDDCVACYESCGQDCTQAGTSPETYNCPDDLGEGSGGGAE